jgi:hypothetical protein
MIDSTGSSLDIVQNDTPTDEHVHEAFKLKLDQNLKLDQIVQIFKEKYGKNYTVNAIRSKRRRLEMKNTCDFCEDDEDDDDYNSLEFSNVEYEENIAKIREIIDNEQELLLDHITSKMNCSEEERLFISNTISSCLKLEDKSKTFEEIINEYETSLDHENIKDISLKILVSINIINETGFTHTGRNNKITLNISQDFHHKFLSWYNRCMNSKNMTFKSHNLLNRIAYQMRILIESRLQISSQFCRLPANDFIELQLKQARENEGSVCMWKPYGKCKSMNGDGKMDQEHLFPPSKMKHFYNLWSSDAGCPIDFGSTDFAATAQYVYIQCVRPACTSCHRWKTRYFKDSNANESCQCTECKICSDNKFKWMTKEFIPYSLVKNTNKSWKLYENGKIEFT